MPTTTIIDQAEKSVRVQNWYSILDNEPQLLETLLAFDDTANEVTTSDAAMRVIFNIDREETQ
jgi:hypothetical protein